MRTRRGPNRWVIVVVAATMTAFLLAACTPKTAQASVLRVGWSSEPDTMNPMTSYSTEAAEVQQLIYDKLLEYDTSIKQEPGLAESSTYTDGGKTITYTLRSGVKWQDGEPFTSEDVKFTFELINKESLSQYAQWLTGMTSVDTPDAQTVEVHFSRAQAFDPGLAIPILPEHIWKGMSADQIQKFPNDDPVGTGPYTLDSWKRGESVDLTRNADWWGKQPAAKRIVFVLYGNEDIMVQGLQAGEIDVVTEVPPTIWDGLSNGDSVKKVSLPGYSFHHIGFNVSTEPSSKGNPLLLDPVIRQSLNYAVDRNQLVQIALAGHGQPGSVLLPPGLEDWHLDIPEDQQMNDNAKQANQMLDQAGYTDQDNDGVRESKNGDPLEFRLIAIESTTVDVRAAELFRDAAKQVGIKLDLQTMDENTLGSTVYNTKDPDWDIFVWGWDSGVADPDYLLGVPLCSQIGGNNDVFYCDKKYDALYDQQATTVDPDTRGPIVDRAQKLFYDSAAYIVMWYQDKLQAYRTDAWQGWVESPGGIVFNFTRDNYLDITPVST